MKIFTTVLLVILNSIVNAQTVQWVQNGGGTSFDGSYSVCVDAQGYSYVAGRFTGKADFSGNTITSFGLQDGFLAKYDPAGNVIWVNHFGGLSMDFCSAISLDNNGHIIIAGQFAGISTFGSITLVSNSNSYDCFVAQYDTSGSCLWALEGGSSASYDNISGIAIDAADDIYVIGWLSPGAVLDWYTAPNTGVASTFVAKIRSTGSLIWVTPSCSHSSGSMPLYALKVALDAGGNVFITSNFSGNCIIGGSPVTAVGLQDAYIQKLNFMGNIIWTRIISGFDDDAAYGLVIDIQGNVVVSGYFKGTINFGGLTKSSNANSQDIFLVKYDNFGGLLWVQSYGGTNSDYAGSVTVTSNNDIILAASFSMSTQIGSFPFTSNGGIDALVVYANASGIPLWVIKMGGTGTDQAIGITENSGNIFCSGLFNATANFNGIAATSNGTGDAFLVKINVLTPLPVQLIVFDATIDSKNNSVNCKWTTTAEINNDFFTLERSADGVLFETIAQLKSISTNSIYQNYNFVDEHPLTGVSYYRLSQTDVNGTHVILKTVTANFKNNNSFSINCYPAFGNGELTIHANKSWNEIKVFDLKGILIKDVFQTTSSTFFNLTDLKKGIYFIQCVADDLVDSQKIIIQ
jgi:hypothetical protein